MESKGVFVVIPGFNIAGVLPKTISEIPADFADDILVVDDGSGDSTSDAAKQLGLRVIVHKKNQGYGGAQKTGYKTAVREGAKAVVLVHGDNQYEPALMPVFAKKIVDEGFDVVTGSRMISGDALREGMPVWKFIPNRFLTWLENLVFQTDISDYHNGYRAYSADFLKKVPLGLLSDDYDFDTDIIIQAAIRKCKIAEIPHKTRYLEENTKMSFRKGIIYGLKILKTLTRYIAHKLQIYPQKIYEI